MLSIIQLHSLPYGRATAPYQPPATVGGSDITPIFSLNIFTPRCRFTLTDAEVSPVRAAISGPVIHSTNRSPRVSRYASGRLRIKSRISIAMRLGDLATAVFSVTSTVSLELR